MSMKSERISPFWVGGYRPFSTANGRYVLSVQRFEAGSISVTELNTAQPELLDGMNVRVVVERSVPRMFVVPKDAVVERDGLQRGLPLRWGYARWTYVDILYSNISHHAVTGCARKETELHEDDILIISGNLNLADGTMVIIKE